MTIKTVSLSVCMVSMSAAAGGFSSEPMINADFSQGDRLDKMVWSRTTGVTANTKVFYTGDDKNIIYQDGELVLEARRERILNPKYGQQKFGVLQKIKFRDVSSVSIASANYFTYGKFEVVADIPDSAGLQPAIWLQGENKNQYGEIDIMEAKGDKSVGVRFATVHAGSSVKDLQRRSSHFNLGAGFHKYTAEWTPDHIKIFYDDNLILVAPAELGSAEGRAPLKQPMQLKINLGGGSRWVGQIDLDSLPQRMRIRSIKVWSYLSSAAK